jgi:hypothetical protein
MAYFGFKTPKVISFFTKKTILFWEDGRSRSVVVSKIVFLHTRIQDKSITFFLIDARNVKKFLKTSFFFKNSAKNYHILIKYKKNYGESSEIMVLQ